MNESLDFSKVVKDCTGGNAKIKQSNYLSEGFLPVVDQGKELIAGYVDDESMKYKGALPCVIFGDHTCILKYVDFDFALGADGTKILVPDADEINAKYLYYFLNTVHIPDRGYSRHFKYLKRYKIPVVSLSEQKQIVQILDTADTLRQKRKEQINLLDDYLKSVFSEMFGDPLRNEKKWSLMYLQDICYEIYRYPTFYGFQYVNSGIPVVKIGNISQDGFVDSNLSNYSFISEEVNNKYPRTILELFDVLMAVRGDGSTVKRIGLVYDNNLVGANMSPNLLRFKTNKALASPIYFYKLITSECGQRIFEQYITQTAKKTITAKDIKKIQIPVPPLRIQGRYEKMFFNVQSTKQKMRASLDEMDNHFNALMQRYFG